MDADKQDLRKLQEVDNSIVYELDRNDTTYFEEATPSLDGLHFILPTQPHNPYAGILMELRYITSLL